AGTGLGRDVVGVGHRRAARAHDPGDGLGGRSFVGASALHRTAEVVDDHRRAASGEELGVGAADPAPRAGDDGDPPVEAVLVQALTGACSPNTPPRVPPTMALRSSSGTPAKSSCISCWLPRKVPSA